MYQFFETIKIYNGEIFNLNYHKKRVEKTFKTFYSEKDILNLEQIIKNIKIPQIFSKLRISYNAENFSIEISPYKRRRIEKIIFIFDDDIEYRYKYEDRSCFTKYTQSLHPSDLSEPIFIVKDYITDTTFSNIALFDGEKWFTPSTCLLEGTKRMELIEKGEITQEEIRLKDLYLFKKISLINSLNELGEIEIPL